MLFYLFSPIILYIIDWQTESTILKTKAVQKESTLKPPTILSQNRIIIALMTNKNKPNVIIVNGKVNNTKIGFIKILSNPRTIATYKAVMNPAI